MDPIEEAIRQVLEDEGGWNDDPEDAGGATCMGITLTTYSRWKGLPAGELAPKDELKALTVPTAKVIYRWYIREAQLEGIPYPNVLRLLIDCAVLHGPDNAAEFLQRGCRDRAVVADGKIGPKTLDCVARRDPTSLYHHVLAERSEFIGRLITKKPTNAKFAAGWLRRAIANWIRRAA